MWSFSFFLRPVSRLEPVNFVMCCFFFQLLFYRTVWGWCCSLETCFGCQTVVFFSWHLNDGLHFLGVSELPNIPNLLPLWMIKILVNFWRKMEPEGSWTCNSDQFRSSIQTVYTTFAKIILPSKSLLDAQNYVSWLIMARSEMLVANFVHAFEFFCPFVPMYRPRFALLQMNVVCFYLLLCLPMLRLKPRHTQSRNVEWGTHEKVHMMKSSNSHTHIKSYAVYIFFFFILSI